MVFWTALYVEVKDTAQRITAGESNKVVELAMTVYRTLMETYSARHKLFPLRHLKQV